MKRSIGRSARLAAMSLAMLAPLAMAQQQPEPPPERPAESVPPSRSGQAPVPADREFKPSESVSPDQEVDFPADI